MRHWKSVLLGLTALGLLLPSVAAAQRKRTGGGRGGLSAGFSKGPAVGDKLPDITAYDAAGKPFRLHSLKGSHTVLVFGCLT